MGSNRIQAIRALLWRQHPKRALDTYSGTLSPCLGRSAWRSLLSCQSRKAWPPTDRGNRTNIHRWKVHDTQGLHWYSVSFSSEKFRKNDIPLFSAIIETSADRYFHLAHGLVIVLLHWILDYGFTENYRVALTSASSSSRHPYVWPNGWPKLHCPKRTVNPPVMQFCLAGVPLMAMKLILVILTSSRQSACRLSVVKTATVQ